MKLLEGHNWVYTIHILLVAPLLFYLSIGYLTDNKLNDDFYKFAMWTLLAFAILMLGYHGNKLVIHL